jgi:hypothetical protein
MPLPGLGSSFNEPPSDDPTSAPPMPGFAAGADQQPQAPPHGLAQALAARKKKPVGPTIKTPSTLATAISRAKRARQGGDKYG